MFEKIILIISFTFKIRLKAVDPIFLTKGIVR